jgi:alpha-L-fucosidase
MKHLAPILTACLLSFGPFSAGDVRAQSEAAPLPQAALERWRESRFGMFIHWGPVALEGTEIGWSRGRQVPREKYDSLYRSFDPVKFDADEWVRIAKQAGMRYIVLTTKHHDGFCLWDSDQTEYDVMNTPFGRDVVKELSEACRRGGIAFGAYYSILDWYQPDYNTTGNQGGAGYVLPGGEVPSMDRYETYLQAQLRELVTKYGPLLTFWFDGEWEKPWTVERGVRLFRYCRELQADVLVNNRVGKARQGMAGTTAQSAANPGDYDTPEQRIGAFQDERPWETCMTICNQWAWKPGDAMKSLEQCLHTLIRTAGGDGNLLFNVGPMPDGRIEPRQVERLREMGEWLTRYGKSIYGTRGGPFYPDRWGCSTHRGATVYVHLFDRRGDEVYLPGLDQRIASAKVLTGGSVTFDQEAERIRLTLENCRPDEIDTLVELTLESPVAGMARSRRAPSLFELGGHGEWISREGTYEASSIAEEWSHDEKKLLTDEPFDGEFNFHTQKEVRPFIVIDLGQSAMVKGIEVENRLGRSYWDRASTLTLWLSSDGEKWQEIWHAEGGKEIWEVPLKRAVTGDEQLGIHARYLKLGLTDEEPGYLHLHGVKVYGDR